MTSPTRKERRAGGTSEIPKRAAAQRDSIAGAPVPAGFSQVQIVADLLDRAIRIPGTNIRFGLDPILGLLPGAGDLVGAGLSGYVIILAARAGASKSLLARMVANVAVDSLLGSVPALGDLFDFAWKSNTKNVDLLRDHLELPAQTARASRGFVAVMVALVALLAAGAVWAAFYVGRLLRGLVLNQ